MIRTFDISGMKCRSCKLLIEDEVSGIGDVENISVSLDGNCAEVCMNKDCTDEIIDRIERLGFLPRVRE